MNGTRRFLRGWAVVLGLAAAVTGCRDELAAPTQGFIEIDTGGVTNVLITLDGEEIGYDRGRLGPLEQGRYVVLATREGFETSPAAGVEVEVRPAETALARLTLTATEFGSIRVTATGELTGGEIVGADILIRSEGQFVPTGATTPATIGDVPLGPATILVRAEDSADAAMTVDVRWAETVDAPVEVGPRRKVLGEMFTYQTCPNCPASAELLDEIAHENPGRFLVIEWHSLYHARFDLYDDRWKAREDAYTVDVPQMQYPGVVIQGGRGDTPRMLLGSEPTELDEYRVRAAAALSACETDCGYALRVEGEIGPAAAGLTARIKWRGGAAADDLKLRFVLLENEVEAFGVGGPFDYVPREYQERTVTFSSPGEILEIPANLPVDPSWDGGSLGWVVYLQSDATLEILAVDGTS